jgi:SET domain-containing protein
MTWIQNGHLYLQTFENKGRGVCSVKAYDMGEIIEICPVVVLDNGDSKHLDNTRLYDYYFLWGEESETAAVALGFGSLYNHSFEPNAHYYMDFEEKTITITALKDIEPKTEITINYNGDPENQDPVWFM